MYNLTEIVNEIVVQFQERNIDGFCSHLHPDFTWIQKDGTPVVKGVNNFRIMIEETWKENPQQINESSECLQIGNLVTHTETFTGNSNGQIDYWIWVYEFSGDKILTMYGFQPTE